MPIPKKIQKYLASDPVLLPYIQKYSSEVDVQIGHTRIYEELINSIIGQQLSGKSAAAIRARFINYFGGVTPDPKTLIKTTSESLRSLGLSGQKANYIKNVAEFWTTNTLFAVDWFAMHEDAIIDLLTQIKGVGKWTVEMVLIFDLARDDVFPVDDLGVKNGMGLVYGKKTTTKTFKKWAIKQSSKWSPYRSWGSRLMWKAYDNRAKIVS